MSFSFQRKWEIWKHGIDTQIYKVPGKSPRWRLERILASRFRSGLQYTFDYHNGARWLPLLRMPRHMHNECKHKRQEWNHYSLVGGSSPLNCFSFSPGSSLTFPFGLAEEMRCLKQTSQGSLVFTIKPINRQCTNMFSIKKQLRGDKLMNYLWSADPEFPDKHQNMVKFILTD